MKSECALWTKPICKKFAMLAKAGDDNGTLHTLQGTYILIPTDKAVLLALSSSGSNGASHERLPKPAYGGNQTIQVSAWRGEGNMDGAFKSSR